jgi:tRNA threonylcarbamoyladenosine biosynthesis protein TsaB
MKVLGIDTSTMTGSIGLIEDDRPLGQYSLSIEVTHSERLMNAIDRLLEGVRIKLDSIDGFAVSIGPGSFTGLRIGLGTVKGLCMATGKHAASVSTLEALASNMPFCSNLICPVLDARKKEVYTALFRYNADGRIIRLTEDMVLSPDLLVEKIQEPAVFSGDGVYVYRDFLKKRLGDYAFFAPVNSILPSGLSGRDWDGQVKKRGNY